MVMRLPKLAQSVMLCGLLASTCVAQTSDLELLPWNDHVAAVSLTFDDARPTQLDVAIPELNKRHLRATFFVIVSKLTRIDDWRRARSQGQELGNHSVSHEHPAELTRDGEEIQVEDAKHFLESNFTTPVGVFAFPYSESSPGLMFWVNRYDFAARGGCSDDGCAEDSFYIRPRQNLNWYNIPSQVALSRYSPDVYAGWIDKTYRLKTWTVFQIHGVGNAEKGWEPLSTTTLRSILDRLKTLQQQGLWVAPFGEVAAYMRAANIVEHAEKRSNAESARDRQHAGSSDLYSWDIPNNFPSGIVLKVRLKPNVRAYQNDRELNPDNRGVVSLAFDDESLVIRRQP